MKTALITTFALACFFVGPVSAQPHRPKGFDSSVATWKKLGYCWMVAHPDMV